MHEDIPFKGKLLLLFYVADHILVKKWLNTFFILYFT